MWTNLCIHITSLLKFRDLRACGGRSDLSKGRRRSCSDSKRCDIDRERDASALPVAAQIRAGIDHSASVATNVEILMHIAHSLQHVHTCSGRVRRHRDASCLSIMLFEVARKVRRAPQFCMRRHDVRALRNRWLVCIDRTQTERI